MRIAIVFALALFPACFQPQDNPLGGPSCPEFGCSGDGDCLQGFVCTHGACAMPVSCGQLEGCPQDGLTWGLDDCLWTGCSCYANATSTPPPPPGCACTTDAQAQAQGFPWCDEQTGTCTTEPQPPESCAAASTCAAAPPACPDGQIPAVRDGCYDGSCRAIASCDVPPPCTVLAYEDDCSARSDCEPEYTGEDCVDSTGRACTAGDANCTCQTFVFSACVAR
ncbi:MAG TPA: hypothetical protein VLX92_02155 [Kofleriaceae bacterium]|nr:hypothetical protein [Kofleriaceae bacterium]